MVEKNRITARRRVLPGCRLVIRRDDCVSCAACPPVCHAMALSMCALRLELREDLCDNCGACIAACPVAALFLQ